MRGPRIADAVDRLRRAQGDGSLEALCRRHGIEVLALHGSVARDEPDPNDIDLAVRFLPRRGDLVSLLVDLVEMLGTDEVDVMDLRRAGVTARARGLAHGAEPLFETDTGAFARAQMAAMALEMDFAPLREEQLRVLAGR